MRAAPIATIAAVSLLTGCGEMGTDPGGPNKAYLTLQTDNGSIREFYLGGYASVGDCLNMLESEARAADEQGGQFWTNPQFSYGGVQEEGWIRHRVLGAKCVRSGR